MKNTDKVTLFFVLLAGMYFCVLAMNLILVDIAIRVSSTTTWAKVEKGITDGTGNQYLVFSYDNVYDNYTYTITESITLEKSKTKLRGKSKIKISYNRYFPEQPKILDSGRRSLVLLYILGIFLYGYGCYRCILAIFGKLQDSDFM